MISRLSHVQGPVENYAQIPKRIFVMKGGTADIKNRNIFTRRVEVHNLEVLTIRCLFLAYTANRLSMICISRGSLVSKVRSSAYNMCETCTPAVPVIAPDTPSAMLSISYIEREQKKQRRQGATLFNPHESDAHEQSYHHPSRHTHHGSTCLKSQTTKAQACEYA